MVVNLKSTSSIVDFLNLQKKDSSFSARRKLFKEAGLSESLGSFVGSAEQNTALLNKLRKGDTTQGPIFQPTRETFEQLNPQFQPTRETFGQLQEAGTTGATPPPIIPSTVKVPPTAKPPAVVSSTEPAAAPPVTTGPPSVVNDIVSGLPEKFQTTEIPDIAPPTGEQILERAQEDTDVQFAKEAAQIGKERIQAALPQQLTAVKDNFASRGLVFSGARTIAEQQTRDAALAKELDIDLRFAEILGNAIDRAQNELGKEFEQIIEDAKDQRKAEVDFLKSVGLAVDPNTGELFPTLEARRFENEEFRNELSVANLDLNRLEASIRFGQAEDRLELDKARFGLEERRVILAEQKAAAGDGGLPGSTISPDDLTPLARLVYDGTYSIKDLTPTVREQIGPELNAVGWTSAIALEDRQTVEVVRAGLDDVLSKWSEVGNIHKGIIQGRFAESAIGTPRFNDPDVAAFVAAKSVVGQQLTRLFEQGRLSDADRNFYQKLMPNLISQDLDVVTRNANTLKQRLDAQLTNQIKAIGSGGVLPADDSSDISTEQVVEAGGAKWRDNGDGTFTRIE